MREKFKKIWASSHILRRTVAIILIVIGLASIITPFTPVGFLLVVGLEILGVRFLAWDKLKSWYKNKDTK